MEHTNPIPEYTQFLPISREDMAQSLRINCREGDVLLFKGSHGMHMELVLEQLLKEER